MNDRRFPIDDGFFMPAEWERHDRCWMAWPARPRTWGDNLIAAHQAYAKVAQTIAQFEPVTMVAPANLVNEARFACGRSVEVVEIDISDSWMRDSGPTFLIDGQGGVAGVDWSFNGWGNKYADYEADREMASSLLAALEIPCYSTAYVLEGGAIHVDGQGTLLTVEQCLLNPNRNPLFSRDDIEQVFLEMLGVRKVIWLGEGLVDDETDGHVDNVACFLRPGVVAVSLPEDPADENYPIMLDNIARLQSARDAAGRKLEIVTLPQPARRETAYGQRLTLSYINSYFANEALIVPSFDDPFDEPAVEILQRALPERKVVTAPGEMIVQGGGCIHCITQQQPTG